MAAWFSQHGYDIRCEWGLYGVDCLLENSDAMIIVDVLSFSTSVDIAVSNGAFIYPYPFQDDSLVAYAQSIGAVPASPKRGEPGKYSLAPSSLTGIFGGTRLVLSSQNGARLSLASARVPTFAGCLRNAKAVANAAQAIGGRISVIPAGERWADGSIRPAIEDWVGAGAIIHYLSGTCSPESEGALAVFQRFTGELPEVLAQCSSGRELIAQGFTQDVELAARLEESRAAPQLTDGRFQDGASSVPG